MSKFIIYSIFGLIAFLVPININGESLIFIGHIKNFLLKYFSNWITCLIVLCCFITIIGTIYGYIKKDFKNKKLQELFITTKFSGMLRIIGATLYLLVIFKIGPNIISSSNTGGLMALDMLPSLMITFFIGIMLMPLLTSFGLVEFVGTMISPFMRKIFKVPGYAAIDALASFLGDGTIGIVVTDEQYKKGYYSQKEAVIIATSFSIVGISFAAVVADLLKLSNIFWIFYGTIAVSTVIAGFIIARIPFRKYSDIYYNNNRIEEYEIRNFSEAVKLAVKTAESISELEVLKESLFKVLIVYITFIPVIMCIGTIGLILVEHTKIFNLVSTPLVPFLEMLGFGRKTAIQMAPGMIIGIVDMYLPALLIKSSTDQFAKFLIGALSFAQLIFFSETGMILVNSKMGFNIYDVIKFFILRTIITFPIIYLIGVIIFK